MDIKLIDLLNGLVQFLRDAGLLGAVILFYVGLIKGWWYLGREVKELKERIVRLENMLENANKSAHLSTRVTAQLAARRVEEELGSEKET